MLEKVLKKAMECGLIAMEDKDYTRNLFLEVLALDAPEGEDVDGGDLAECFEQLTENAVHRGVCEDTLDARDRYAARLAGCVTPHPSRVRDMFSALEKASGPRAATAWFYKMCRDVDYIRVHRVAQNIQYTVESPCGELEITYNLSKPEKDPRDIAKARTAKQSGYPKCMLCRENPGYAGRVNFPARQNHRILPVQLAGEKWYLQYSPYLYYNEHCIVFNSEHVPMHMTEKTFERLLDFAHRFPHYFIGANADLPIVGGSILSHDHYQGGGYVFPMEKAQTLYEVEATVKAEVINWPMTCLKFVSWDYKELIRIANRVLEAWRAYTDEEAGIYAETNGEKHNAVTPVVRKNGDVYTMYLVLRNNRVSEEHPLGIFHPHADLHHIKKENIGLIEVMGLFILPGRLKTEMAELKPYLMGRGDLPENSPHREWAEQILRESGAAQQEDEAEALIRREVGKVCHRVLCDCGVFKQDEKGKQQLNQFLHTVGMQIR
ncbi:MAG: UDP-glucose--hexose-1-phosphate uridylyltransferase [Clostridiales bacterium]|nr:UDP-glucose--hexose-1-phosphate uridylyltransferase [Clostridiales bacterium]